jgi:prenyltransferase beta subunit
VVAGRLLLNDAGALALQQTDTFEFYVTEHFRLGGVYWGLTAMALLGRLHQMDQAAIVAWVLSCQARRSPRPAAPAARCAHFSNGATAVGVRLILPALLHGEPRATLLKPHVMSPDVTC